MILLEEVEGISLSFVVFASFVEFNILAQLVVHSATEGLGKSNGGLVVCIYCMVSIVEFFNLYLISQSIEDLFFLGFWPLNTCSTLVLLQVVTLTSTMLTKVIITLVSIMSLGSMVLPPISLNMSCILPNLGQFINLWPIIPQM
jgi:hypothetical protein